MAATLRHTAGLLAALAVPILLHLLSKEKLSLPSRRLILGVLSARDHFYQREAIRQSWGSLTQSLADVEMKFVLGDQDCPIHPTDRISSHECKRWYMKREMKYSQQQIFFKRHNIWHRKNFESLMSLECYIGFGFRVIHPIVVEAVIVQTKLFKRSDNFVILLSDPEEVIETIQVSDGGSCSEGSDTCSIKLPYPLRLPKGFEGEFRVFNTERNEDILCGREFFTLQDTSIEVCEWNNNSLLEYKFLRNRKNTLTKWKASSCPLVSATFTVADQAALVKLWKEQAIREGEWRQHLTQLQQKVEEEANQHQDLLILSHLDVYAHLPNKVMAFLHWVTQTRNFSYVMKVDDDTFVNVSLLNDLAEEGVEEQHVWWSLFHHHRAVPVYGKWADLTYPSLTYPTFPAGAGYLLTKSLAHAVAGAQDHLVPHGGEDVSMGIWVSSVSNAARQVEVPCWLPHSQCSYSVLIPQLSAKQMMEVWQNQTDTVIKHHTSL